MNLQLKVQQCLQFLWQSFAQGVATQLVGIVGCQFVVTDGSRLLLRLLWLLVVLCLLAGSCSGVVFILGWAIVRADIQVSVHGSKLLHGQAIFAMKFSKKTTEYRPLFYCNLSGNPTMQVSAARYEVRRVEIFLSYQLSY